MEIIGVIIAGIVIGLLGKWWLGPGGRDDIGLVTTTVSAVVGAVMGWYAAAGLGIGTDAGELARWTLSIVVGSALAAIVATLSARSVAGRL